MHPLGSSHSLTKMLFSLLQALESRSCSSHSNLDVTFNETETLAPDQPPGAASLRRGSWQGPPCSLLLAFPGMARACTGTAGCHPAPPGACHICSQSPHATTLQSCRADSFISLPSFRCTSRRGMGAKPSLSSQTQSCLSPSLLLLLLLLIFFLNGGKG